MSDIELHDIGDCRRLTGTFTISDAPTDPSTIIFSMLEPGGTKTSYTYGTDVELVKASTGVFRVDWTFALVGRHQWYWDGDGSVIAAGGGVCYVEGSAAA